VYKDATEETLAVAVSEYSPFMISDEYFLFKITEIEGLVNQRNKQTGRV